MKKLSLLAFLGLTTLCVGQSNPEDIIPTFNLDDYFVQPKFTISVGARALTGTKTTFGGQGLLETTQGFGDSTSTSVIRNYYDGAVYLDNRTGATDGKTDSWAVATLAQFVNNNEDVTFHAYSAQITDASIRSKDTGLSLGTELVVSRDMGKITDKLKWKLFAGLSMNGIAASVRDGVTISLTTVTDTYSMDGQSPPATTPFVSPSNATDSLGNVAVVSILLDRKPDNRTTTTETNSDRIVNFWNLKGTYLTFRVGPTLIYDLSENFSLSVSAGPVLAYAGTTYSVEQSLKIDNSPNLTTTAKDTSGNTLSGYYVDTTLEYAIGDRAGLYLGAFYQDAGTFTQATTQAGSSYTTNVDLSRLQGFRGGLNYKF